MGLASTTLSFDFLLFLPFLFWKISYQMERNSKNQTQYFNKKYAGAGKMAQWVKVIKSHNVSSIPGIHMVGENWLPKFVFWSPHKYHSTGSPTCIPPNKHIANTPPTVPTYLHYEARNLSKGDHLSFLRLCSAQSECPGFKLGAERLSSTL